LRPDPEREREVLGLKCEVLIIGGGPAGMSAAITARRLGASVTIVEEKDALGGQLIKQTHKFFGSKQHYAGVRGIEIATILENELKSPGVTVLTDTTVTGIHNSHIVGAVRQNKFFEIEADRIIVATGAYENMLSFPNSDLPGVCGAGGVQTLMNVEGIRPGKDVVMVGAGNIGLIVSYQLMQSDVNVVCVVEALPRVGGYDVHARKLQRLSVPILLEHTIVRVDGRESVESVTLARAKNFRIIEGTEFSVDCDAVCIAVGLTPLSELLALVGCQMRYIAELGGYVAWHDENMRTSLNHIYLAGDVSGIEEASTAMVEGKIAGLTAAHSLGYCSDSQFEKMRKDFEAELSCLRGGPFGEKACAGKRRLGALREVEPSVRDDTDKEGQGGKTCETDAGDGAKAVIECYEKIPCDPCVSACRFGAIEIGIDINDIPRIDLTKCTGCGECVGACPGLAIFVVDRNFSDKEAQVGIPYEFLPQPAKGDVVAALSREGVPVCDAKVTRVRKDKKFPGTAVVYITLPKRHADSVRFFALKGREKPPFMKKNPRTGKEDIIICRCEDIYQSQVEALIDSGYHSFDELKRILRCGMGPCQGKTCQRLILGILSRKLSKRMEDLQPQTARSPVKPVQLGAFAGADIGLNLADWPEKRGGDFTLTDRIDG
jgi:thioredoxin reductase/Fe-S-cluster-containing hydrogenase component 2/bacterioferritin-associated ferredoxin